MLRLLLTLLLVSLVSMPAAAIHYDEQFAKDMFLFAHAAYEENEPYMCAFNGDGVSHYYGSVNSLYDGAFVAYNEDHDAIVVAFGSRDHQGVEEIRINVGRSAPLPFGEGWGDAYVVNLWHQHLVYVREASTEAGATLGELLVAAKRAHPQHSKVVFTGHGKGAALATLAAVHEKLGSSLSSAGEESTSSDIWLVTFGSPRVGNWRFASRAAELLGMDRVLRITRGGDPVVHTPECHHMTNPSALIGGRDCVPGDPTDVEAFNSLQKALRATHDELEERMEALKAKTEEGSIDPLDAQAETDRLMAQGKAMHEQRLASWKNFHPKRWPQFGYHVGSEIHYENAMPPALRDTSRDAPLYIKCHGPPEMESAMCSSGLTLRDKGMTKEELAAEDAQYDPKDIKERPFIRHLTRDTRHQHHLEYFGMDVHRHCKNRIVAAKYHMEHKDALEQLRKQQQAEHSEL